MIVSKLTGCVLLHTAARCSTPSVNAHLLYLMQADPIETGDLNEFWSRLNALVGPGLGCASAPLEETLMRRMVQNKIDGGKDCRPFMASILATTADEFGEHLKTSKLIAALHTFVQTNETEVLRGYLDYYHDASRQVLQRNQVRHAPPIHKSPPCCAPPLAVSHAHHRPPSPPPSPPPPSPPWINCKSFALPGVVWSSYGPLCADLRGVNLTAASMPGADFGGVLFDYAIFRAADLTEVDFQATASCRYADFEGASLARAQLEHIDASGAVFDRAVLHTSGLDHATLTGASFVSAGLRNTKLTDVSAARASFKGAQLIQADFANSYLVNSSFDGADVHEANFQGCNLEGASFVGARGLQTADFSAARGNFTWLGL